MTELKTKLNNASVADFLKTIEDPQKRKDCKAIQKLCKEATGSKPKMWGASIVGFGSYHYKGASGREGDWMVTGFSPRKANISIYLMSGFDDLQSELKVLGKHKTGKGCLYIKSLDDIDVKVLAKMIKRSVSLMKKQHPCTF